MKILSHPGRGIKPVKPSTTCMFTIITLRIGIIYITLFRWNVRKATSRGFRAADVFTFGFMCVQVCVSPVHVHEEEVIPSNQVETNSSSTKRNQHHL